MSKYTAQEKRDNKAKALEYLTGLIGEGATLWTQTNYIGNVGTADVRTFLMVDNEPHNVTWYVSWAIGDTPRDNREGQRVIRTKGYGYSRSQHVADALSFALFHKSGLIRDREM